ncbi:MFS general substrate transporter [Sistotremastrum niveocremeum HHB9708]|uniref:MFS general substrate transporter n=1 Tax=Sistotremastrum niveocremeum HHB9708 TaxID=1314777 RepID=A0A164Y9X9_9AGAM|nr:MFS general substrate transporter [Sistotremastrum niveocremeum HHB9708]
MSALIHNTAPHSTRLSNSSVEKVNDDLDIIEYHPSRLLRRALWKIDLTVMPIVIMLYFLSFLPHRNIGNAKVAGLTTDLKMGPTQFSVALTVTYIPYILIEIPANLVLKRFGANRTLPLLVVLWGIATTSQGAVTSYHGLIACRFFLGLAEGGILPGLILYLSSFYRRDQMNVRMSLLFTATSLAGAFSGLLAAAISNLAGKGGKPGWAWIFMLEGAFTVLVGLLSFFIMPKRPEEATFLTLEEKEELSGFREDWISDEHMQTFSWSEVGSTFKEPHLYLFSLGLFAGGTTLFGLTYFAPSIVNSLGHSANRSQLLTVPPYAVAFVVSIIASYLSDKYRQRGITLIGCSILMLVGYSMFLGSSNKHVDYGSLILQVTGTYTAAPAISAWVANNFQPHYRRATAISWAFMITNCGGIISYCRH